MIAEIKTEALTKVFHHARRGDDPLKLAGHLKKGNTGDAWTIVHAALDGVDAETAVRLAASLDAILSGRTPAVREDKPPPPMPINRLYAQMIQHLDVDPLVATWLGVVAYAIDLGEDTTDGIVFTIETGHELWEETNYTKLWLDDLTTWAGRGEITLVGVPDTIAIAAVSRPLSTLVSHPVLDLHDLTITDVDITPVGTTFTVAVSREPVTSAELVALGPCGCR